MTEEDTFNTLKKWTYEDAVDFYLHRCPGMPDYEARELLSEITHWTHTELSTERQRRLCT